MPDGDRRKEDRDTRDIAVVAKNTIELHLQDCATFRAGVTNAFSEVRGDIKKFTWILAGIVGGATILGKVFDAVMTYPQLHQIVKATAAP